MMQKLVLMLAPLALLSACDAEVRTPAAGNEKVALAANQDGRVAFDLPFAKGEIKLPAAMMAEANFDIDGVRMVPGGQVTGFNLDAGKDQPGKVNLTFSAPTSPQAVQAYFLDQFRAQGVQAAMAADVLQGVTRDGAAFRMRFAPQGTGTSGTIEIDAGK